VYTRRHSVKTSRTVFKHNRKRLAIESLEGVFPRNTGHSNSKNESIFDLYFFEKYVGNTEFESCAINKIVFSTNALAYVSVRRITPRMYARFTFVFSSTTTNMHVSYSCTFHVRETKPSVTIERQKKIYIYTHNTYHGRRDATETDSPQLSGVT